MSSPSNVYIRIPALFEYEEDESLDEIERLIRETNGTTFKGYDYIKISGNMAMGRFYSDGEGGVTAVYGIDYIHYPIPIEVFLSSLKGYIKVIECERTSQ